jgi:hypothetical protein
MKYQVDAYEISTFLLFYYIKIVDISYGSTFELNLDPHKAKNLV